MVGRILKHLKERRMLREPPRNRVATSWHHHPRPYAMRKPRDYRVEKPGDLVQVDTLEHRLPFPLRALQVDGGSEFAAQFEAECPERGIRLFVLPPRFPKLKGYRIQSTPMKSPSPWRWCSRHP